MSGVGLCSYREKTGEGQSIDIAMLDSMFHFLFDELFDKGCLAY